MKRLLIFSALWAVLLGLSSCGGSTENKTETTDKAAAYGETKVEVYYFHGDRRCPTCNAIEEVTKSFLDENYKGNTDVAFFVVNFDKEENKDIATKFEVSWSSLFIASGDKKLDLTIEAFQYAKSDPAMLTNEMKDIIDGFLK